MKDNGALGAIKRRWWIIVLFAVAGAVVGALPAPEQVEEQERTFTATHTLLLNDTTSQDTSSAISPGQVTLFVTTGEVPARAAERLGYTGNPASLASQVTPLFDFSNGALTVSARGPDGAQAEDIADTFADELTSYLAERQDIIYQERLTASLDRLSEQEDALINVTRDLAADPDDPILRAQQSAISRRYSVAFEQSETLDANPPVLGFTTLQRAQAVEVIDRGLSAPRSRSSRAILGGIVGVAVGLGSAVLLGVLDRRIRTREQAEEAMGMRARVLVPKVRDRDRDQLVVRSDRHDALSDSYRTIRNVVAFVQGSEQYERAPITLVVSASPGDGKTSLATNLAAASAEAGHRTVLVNADFRRPRLASVFGPDAEQPLPFLLEDVERLNTQTMLTKSGITRLRLLDLSSVDGSAGDLVRATVGKLEAMVAFSEAVIVDTSPVGATAEVLDLVPHADTIVIVARVGHTTIAQAERAIGILRDLTTVPILLVLGGLRIERSQYDEYTDRRTKDTPGKRPWWRRRGTTRMQVAAAEAGEDTTDEVVRDELAHRHGVPDDEPEPELETAE